MKIPSLFVYNVIAVAALAAFVVGADTTPPPPALVNNDDLSLATTPPAIKISIDDGLGDEDAPAVPEQKNKQQQIQKHIQEAESASDDVGDEPAKTNHKAPTATRTAPQKKKSVRARHMVCSVVVGSLICYSVNQDDIVFDASECVVAPIPDNADGKNYTVCSRSLI
jgi:hypothetical protein